MQRGFFIFIEFINYQYFHIFVLSMARIIGIDFGGKRCGISVTDPLKIIVTGLDTLDTSDLMAYLVKYMSTEAVEKIVVGLPVHRDGNFTYLKKDIDLFVEKLKSAFPELQVDFGDEQFSSSHAKKIIFDSGVKKEKRKDKSLIDKVSAVVILQRYLGHI
jgi:putative Holliday junction resolvase